ncbi:MAG: hypothetical protein BA863_07605 [Desulfovibrio sp. S3730MH75]|nr:MAG: hypothetical protein BA863_07605 [Desulfovibrio sp. S3730MH75]
MTTKPLLFCWLLILLFPATTYTADASDLIITIEGLKSSKGKVRVALFCNEDSFNKAKKNKDDSVLSACNRKAVAASEGSVSCIFEQIKHGEYAVAVFHDEDNNNQLKKLLWGLLPIPREPYGKSGKKGGKNWIDCKFKHDENQKEIKIEVSQ